MANPELIEYAKNQIKAGSSPNYIRTVLIKQGWSERDVDDALGIAQADIGPVREEPKPAEEARPEPSPKNKFLFIAGILTGAFFLISAIFSIMAEMQLLTGMNVIPTATAIIELLAGIFWIIIAVKEFMK